jgi:hypothetical protein
VKKKKKKKNRYKSVRPTPQQQQQHSFLCTHLYGHFPRSAQSNPSRSLHTQDNSSSSSSGSVIIYSTEHDGMRVIGDSFFKKKTREF